MGWLDHPVTDLVVAVVGLVGVLAFSVSTGWPVQGIATVALASGITGVAGRNVELYYAARRARRRVARERVTERGMS